MQPPESRQLPAVLKLRVRFAKRGQLRFASHRDFQRAFERAVRRAGVPVAFSHGFTPHPKISYAGAAPTGAASEAEYLELSLTAQRAADDVRVALDAALPPGLDVLDVVVAGLPPARWPTSCRPASGRSGCPQSRTSSWRRRSRASWSLRSSRCSG